MKLLFDFFPIVLFFIAFKTYGIFVATGVAIAASFIQVGTFWLKYRRFETMHLITLGIIVVFGGLTLLLKDRVFIMWKPSVINWLFAAAFLGSQLFSAKTLVERMMSSSITLIEDVWGKLNMAWVVFFIVMGLANLYVANYFFQADKEWRLAAGIEPNAIVEEFECESQPAGQVQKLCMRAVETEEQWVNFKLFGMLGLTIIFVIGQGFWLARYIQEEEEEEEIKKDED